MATTTTTNDDDDDSNKLLPPDTAMPRSQRARKSAQAFCPDDFSSSSTQNRATIVKGRGTPLADIPSVQASIHDMSKNSQEMAKAHSFLFGGRKARKYYKPDLLAFSGFLVETDTNSTTAISKEEMQVMDEEVETKMSEKAFKLTIAELKMLCDFFTIDRSAHDGESMTKDVLVDRLLDFLGAPDVKLTKQEVADAKKRKHREEHAAAATLAEKKPKKTPKPQDDKETLVVVLGPDGLPTDKALRSWVRHYVACFNLDKVTTKHALQTASDKFGVDLISKKSLLKQMLTEEM